MKQLFFLVALFTLAITPFANAQMFSVGNSDANNFNPFTPYLRAGISTVDFSYEGDPQQIALRNRLSMSGTGIYLGFESNGLNADITLVNKLTGQDNSSLLQMGLRFNNPLPLVRRKTFTLALPLQLGTEITSVRNENSNDEFSQTGLSAGVGGLVQIRAAEVLSFTSHVIPTYGFSSSSGGFFGGSVFGVNGKARLNFYNLLFSKNISFGFDYKFNSYDIDGETLDYDLEKLTFTIGVSL
ncbi:MAG: hypothetical protein FH748_05165 [Balneolaceae bacterium]|nr:hypothetical protein [Balneolaceae bacterium]